MAAANSYFMIGSHIYNGCGTLVRYVLGNEQNTDLLNYGC